MPHQSDPTSFVHPGTDVPAGDPDTPLPFATHPMIELALRMFERDLPQLWEQRPGQWVAYHGNRQVGFGKTRAELLRKFRGQGIPDEELQVCLIEPHDEEEEFLGLV